MYLIVELTRTESITIYAAPALRPFVIAYKLYYGASNSDIADFWTTTFGVTEEAKLKTQVTGVVYNYAINYSLKDNISDCLNDFRSFYWASENQELTIRYGMLEESTWQTPNMQYGIAIGLTKDKVRYFEDREYLPLISSLEPVAYDIDKFNYDKLNFAMSTLILNNLSGHFNQFKDTPIYGNLVTVKTGEEGDTYSELILRRAYYIEDYDFSAQTLTIDIQDSRKALSTQVPTKYFDVADYPNIGDSAVGEAIPFGYGQLREVPGKCINENAVNATVNPIFIFVEILSSATVTVEVKIADVWTVQTSGVTVDINTGQVTVVGARAGSSPNFTVRPTRAEVVGIANTYASDIIKDMNDRFLGIPYDTSNYNQTEWEAEEVYLEPIGLYIDKVDYVYNYIRNLQAASSVGFRYDTIQGKRTIIIDNPNKDVTVDILPPDIFNITNVVADSNKADMYNKVIIGYNQAIESKTALRKENSDYYSISFSNYKIVSIYDVITGLNSELAATNRASIQAEDLHLIRRVFNLRVYGDKFLDLKLLDIVNATIDIKKFNIETITTLQGVLNSQDVVEGIYNSLEVIEGMLSSVIITDESANLFGTIRGQVIAVKPDYDLKINDIKIRERPYSQVWEDIYG